jgi:hypothetical protein
LKNVGHLPVQQQEDNSSCGIHAAVAIEVACNPEAAAVLHVMPIRDLRLRYLRLLSGYYKVRLFVFFFLLKKIEVKKVYNVY